MAGRRRTSFSGVFITTLLAVMLLPGEYITHTLSHNETVIIVVYSIYIHG